MIKFFPVEVFLVSHFTHNNHLVLLASDTRTPNTKGSLYTIIYFATFTSFDQNYFHLDHLTPSFHRRLEQARNCKLDNSYNYIYRLILLLLLQARHWVQCIVDKLGPDTLADYILDNCNVRLIFQLRQSRNKVQSQSKLWCKASC